VTRCVIADDHPALRATVRDRITADGFEVVAEAADGCDAVLAVEQEHPELAVVDLRMPCLSGRELVRRLRMVAPETRLLVYTADADPSEAGLLLAAGAHGVVLKEAPLADLSRAIRTVLDGGGYLDPTLVPVDRSDTASVLSEREVDALSLLADGLGFEAISSQLSIGVETARTHVRNATARLGAKTKTEAVATAIRLGLIA
jgi:DNA-binding NarL/FixJ family response regulator